MAKELRVSREDLTPAEQRRRRASEVSGDTFLLANAALFVKNGVALTLDTGAGLSWVMSSLAMRLLVPTRPSVGFPVMGASGLGGAVLLAAKGIDFSTLQVADATAVVGPLLGFGTSASLILLRKQAKALAEHGAQSTSALKRHAANLLARPVTLSAGLNLLGVASMVRTAYNESDAALFAIALINTFGNCVMTATDTKSEAGGPRS